MHFPISRLPSFLLGCLYVILRRIREFSTHEEPSPALGEGPQTLSMHGAQGCSGGFFIMPMLTFIKNVHF